MSSFRLKLYVLTRFYFCVFSVLSVLFNFVIFADVYYCSIIHQFLEYIILFLSYILSNSAIQILNS